MSWKRFIDLAIGTPAAFALAPVIGALALVVLATSGRPIFIVQTRVGADERPIRVAKFRTMRPGVPIVAKSLLVPSPHIYTPLGPFLRRWSLDELPQLYNVLVGDMSLVGPRPALPSQEDLLGLRRRRGITRQKPGLTGLAQVKGREALTLASKVRLEALYLKRQSVLLDLAIVVWTVSALFSKRGAY